MNAGEILREVLSLPERERGLIASQILASLEGDEPIDPDHWHRTWTAEIMRRLGAVERGEAEPMPADQIMAELRDLVDADED